MPKPESATWAAATASGVRKGVCWTGLTIRAPGGRAGEGTIAVGCVGLVISTPMPAPGRLGCVTGTCGVTKGLTAGLPVGCCWMIAVPAAAAAPGVIVVAVGDVAPGASAPGTFTLVAGLAVPGREAPVGAGRVSGAGVGRWARAAPGLTVAASRDVV